MEPHQFQELEARYKELVFWKEMKAKNEMTQRTKHLRADRIKHNPILQASVEKKGAPNKVAKRQEDALIGGIAAMKL